MGAAAFYRTGYGANDRQAYDDAYEMASDEKGHQDGYSGDLNSKDGYKLVTPPDGVETKAWIMALRREELPAELAQHQAKFDKHYAIYDDRTAPALCFKTADGEYVFMGIARE